MARKEVPTINRSSDFGEVVRRRRLKARITLRAMARELGVSAAYISDIELGHRNPPQNEMLAKIADLLELDRDYLENLAVFSRRRVSIDMRDKDRSELERQMAVAFARRWDRGRIPDSVVEEILKMLQEGDNAE